MKSLDTLQADHWLTRLRDLPRQDWQPEQVTPLLQRAVEAALRLPPTPSQELRVLLVQSIQAEEPGAENLTTEQILHRVLRYDCHQVPQVLERKVSLLLYIEHFLHLSLRDEEAIGIRTIGDLAQCLIRHRMAEGGPV